MKNIKNKDYIFLTALKEQHKHKGDKSFLSILYCVNMKHQNDLLKNIIKNTYNNEYQKIFEQSEIIFRSQDSFYLGKYKNHFFIYGNEGELFGAGKEIQNTCNVFRELFYAYDINDRRALDNIFKMHHYPPYKEVIGDYKIFCKQFDLEYNENDLYWQQQAEDFDKFICSLD